MRYMLGLLLSEAQKREDATLAGLAGKLGDVSGGVGKLLFDQSDTFRTQARTGCKKYRVSIFSPIFSQICSRCLRNMVHKKLSDIS